VEGRVAIQYVNPQNPKDNFTFKCHRSNGAPNGYQDIYAVSMSKYAVLSVIINVDMYKACWKFLQGIVAHK
jgi:hypothetical protein